MPQYQEEKCTALGPAPCAVAKINYNFRYRLSLRCRMTKELRLLLAQNNNRNMLLDNNLHLACATPAIHELFSEELKAKDSPVKCSDICRCGISDSSQCPALEAAATGRMQLCRHAKIANSILQIKPLLNENNTTSYLSVSFENDTEPQVQEEVDA